jgi:hypothetical protein
MALQVHYTPTALADMAWFRRYYGNVFPNGHARRTLFCSLYRVRPAGIEIIRIIETRSVWPFGAAGEI